MANPLRLWGDPPDREEPVKEFNVDRLQHDPTLVDRVNALRPVFSDVLGQSEGLVRAHWRPEVDPLGRPVVSLNLSDYTCPTGIDRGFTPEDLANPQKFRSRLRDAWGDLVWAKFQKSVAELQAMTAAEVTS